MKKKCVLMLVLLCLGMSACGVSKADYDAVVAEKESVSALLASVESEAAVASEKAKHELESVSAAYALLESDYDAYKESMKIYEGVEAAEAEARIAKAEQEAESIAASKAAKESEAAAKAKAESEAASKAAAEKEKKGYETGITYDQLARNPEKYQGEKVKFKGKVVQLIEGDDEIQIRLAINSDYDKILYCGYDPSIVSSRVLEDDIITIYGISVGTISYDSTMSGRITIPAAYVEKIDQKTK